jgi:Ca2+-transporting ATPase
MILSSGMIFEKFGGPGAIAQSLLSSSKTGIQGDMKDLEVRTRVYGPNSFPPPKIKSLYELVMENFDDPINVILLGAAIVSVVIGLLKEGFPEGLIEGTSIMIALFLIIVVNSGNNWISERRLANLVKLSDAQEVAVFRGSD